MAVNSSSASHLPLLSASPASPLVEVEVEKHSPPSELDPRSLSDVVQGFEAVAPRDHECRGAVAPDRLTVQATAPVFAAFSLSETRPKAKQLFDNHYNFVWAFHLAS